MQVKSNVFAFLLSLLLLVAVAPTVAAQLSSTGGGFALLIGVDKYAQPPLSSQPIKDLKGPPQDVALMRGLLIDKYGFSASGSIMTLIGAQATTAAIRAAFRTHLIENAKKHPNAKIMFYFSGHGSSTPDADGDEGDGQDETLVAYDSRIPGGKDIVDDEIEQWLTELNQHTENVTVIFDSCNSGSATKEIGPAAVVARSLPPNPNMQSKKGTVAVVAKGSVEKSGLLRGRAGQSFISGSLPWELSNEGQVLDEQGKAVYRGFMTHYLVTKLRQQPSLTYAKAVDLITPDVLRHARAQHPQADGDTRKPFLGLAADEEQAYVKIIQTPAGKNITIAAGEMHGLGVGALLAVYSSQAKHLIGEKEKLANARAVKVGASSSVIELLDKPSRPIAADDKVAIVTPYFGRYRLSFLKGEMPGQTVRSTDKKVLAGIAELLTDDKLVQAASADNWTVALQRGCLEGGKLTPSSKLGKASASCKPTYYVTTRPDHDKALMIVPDTETDVSATAEYIASFISLKARQDNLRQLENLRSPLNGMLSAALVWKGKDGGATEQEVGANKTARLSPGDYFELKITNSSDQDLYVAVLALGSSGRTYLYGESDNGDLIKAGTTVRAKPMLKAGLPFGFETYKVFATTRPGIDFSVLESEGARKAVGSRTAFDLMLEDYSNANTRDPLEVSKQSVNLDEWVTVKVNAEIIP